MSEAERIHKIAYVFSSLATMFEADTTNDTRRCEVCGGGPVARWLRSLPCASCLRVAADAMKARVAELETGGGLLGLWWFLNGNPDQPMPPGADPCKQAIEAIQALRAERDRLAEIVAAAEAARAKGGV